MIHRKSKMVLGEVYFWTNTIKDWNNLLVPDAYKRLITSTLFELTCKKLIKIYGFVIMPNHLHFIWEMLAMNGKEMPNASFNKTIGHLLIKDLKLNDDYKLPLYQVNEPGRQFRVWKRDPLAVLMNSKNKFEQKLDYIHYNPLQEKWNLATIPEDYYWSSARFYETGNDHFGFMSHYMDRF